MLILPNQCTCMCGLRSDVLGMYIMYVYYVQSTDIFLMCLNASKMADIQFFIVPFRRLRIRESFVMYAKFLYVHDYIWCCYHCMGFRFTYLHACTLYVSLLRVYACVVSRLIVYISV